MSMKLIPLALAAEAEKPGFRLLSMTGHRNRLFDRSPAI
jgi:hypothetical protein